MTDPGRNSLFISHANPEDNAFTIWLGAKLSALGYKVWADVLRLSGGQDWQRRLELALRQFSRKVLLVATPHGVAKQGVRNEIQIAHTTGKSLGDGDFIVPLRLAAFDAPFLVAHAQYVDFERGWAAGLDELLRTLTDVYGFAPTGPDRSQIWRQLQLMHARPLKPAHETLVSNWLRIEQMPRKICRYEFRSGVPSQKGLALIRQSKLPAVPYGSGFLSFGTFDAMQDAMDPNYPFLAQGERLTKEFLRAGWRGVGIEAPVARRNFADLSRQAADGFFRSRGLHAYSMSEAKQAWFGKADVIPGSRIGFKWGDLSGSRQVRGYSTKRELYWHFRGLCFATTKRYSRDALGQPTDLQ